MSSKVKGPKYLLAQTVKPWNINKTGINIGHPTSAVKILVSFGADLEKLTQQSSWGSTLKKYFPPIW